MEWINTLRNNKQSQIVLLESLALLILLTLLYQSTIGDMVYLWLNSETYSHGLFILPLTAILVFNRIHRLKLTAKQPQPFAALLILLLGITWLVSELAKINLISQLAVVAMVPCAVWVRYGFTVLWRLKSAFLFLFLAVPVGDFLIPHLQQITAVLAIAMIKAVGIPVFSDGLYISIPAGNFLVAEACSGIRFLISSITIGVFYAFLYIDSYKRRLIMILAGVFVPILANGMRVFMIIVIAHLGNMEAATGFDHIVYGWVFFSFVMIMLIWLGNYLSEAPTNTMPKQASALYGGTGFTENINASWQSKFIAILAVILTLSFAPISLQLLKSAQPMAAEQGAKAKQVATANALYKNPSQAWAVYYPKADLIERNAIESNPHITTYKISYLNEADDKELITFENKLFNADRWSIKTQFTKPVDVNGHGIPIQYTQLVNLQGKKRNILLVYATDDFYSAKVWQVKKQQVIHKLTQQDFGGRVYIVSAQDDKVPVSELEQQFIQFIQQEQN